MDGSSCAGWTLPALSMAREVILCSPAEGLAQLTLHPLTDVADVLVLALHPAYYSVAAPIAA